MHSDFFPFSTKDGSNIFPTRYPVITVLFIKKTVVASVTCDTALSSVVMYLFLDFFSSIGITDCACATHCFDQRL